MVDTNNIKKGKKSKILLITLLIILILTLLIISMIGYYNKAISSMDTENPEDVPILIPSGSSSSQIAKILKENNLIRNEFVFKVFLKINNKETSLKAGYYVLNTSMSVKDIVDELLKGGKNTNVVNFTIPEGYELKEIAEKLSKEGLVDADRFLELVSDKKNFEDKFTFLKELDEGQSLEGYLFPSTYEIYIGSEEEVIIEKMLSKFQQVYEEKIKQYMDNTNLNLNEIVTLASIIEREAKVDDERDIISGVFHNRLNMNMNLASCATVQYALGERKENLTIEDTKIDSEYNTYIHSGLPPAPIASPGEKSLIAAVNPADVEYLYFRAKNDGSGRHIFSITYEEHLNADPDK